MKAVYLDHNGSAPVAKEVIEAMRPWFESCVGNPASPHVFGQKGGAAIENARGQIASALGCNSEELVFTSGGTESNNLAIKGIAEKKEKGHLITCATEHPSVLRPFEYLEKRGFTITILPVENDGRVNLSELEAALRGDTILVSLMLANNEVGTIQPIEEVAKLLESRETVFHCDAAQVFGKEEVKVAALGADLLTLAGHKCNGPKGVGVLYCRDGIELAPQQLGAGHERGLRAGTMDVMEIVGFGAAARRFSDHGAEISEQYRELRDELESSLTSEIEGATRNGSSEQRLVNTCNIAFEGIVSGDLLKACPDVAFAAGASCHKDHSTPSHVLSAMGYSAEHSESSIRLSLGYDTSREDIDFAVQALKKAVLELRAAK